ncbi:MAG: STAS domain-containing protein [Candidatus Thiodiazotropha sp.]|jgi:HptB-dependent secretion and biofilm anti anti-sigma factor
MSIYSSLSSDQSTVIIRVAGRFDHSIHQDFMQSYKGFPKGEKSYIVDLAGAEYMDSSAMGMLLQLREYNRAGESVRLTNGNDTVTDVLRIAHFDKLFTIE